MNDGRPSINAALSEWNSSIPGRSSRANSNGQGPAATTKHDNAIFFSDPRK